MVVVANCTKDRWIYLAPTLDRISRIALIVNGDRLDAEITTSTELVSRFRETVRLESRLCHLSIYCTGIVIFCG